MSSTWVVRRPGIGLPPLERQLDHTIRRARVGVHLDFGVGLRLEGGVPETILGLEGDFGHLREAFEEPRAYLVDKVLDGHADEAVEDRADEIAHLLDGDV